MTEFETAVAEALRSSGSEIGMAGVQGICERENIDFMVACEMIRAVLDARAPRVAAAIGAMGAAHSDGVHWREPRCEQCSLNIQFGIPAALAALKAVAP